MARITDLGINQIPRKAMPVACCEQTLASPGTPPPDCCGDTKENSEEVPVCCDQTLKGETIPPNEKHHDHDQQHKRHARAFGPAAAAQLRAQLRQQISQ